MMGLTECVDGGIVTDAIELQLVPRKAQSPAHLF